MKQQFFNKNLSVQDKLLKITLSLISIATFAILLVYLFKAEIFFIILSLIGFIFSTILLINFNKEKLSYTIASRLLLIFITILVLIGFSSANSLVSGYIFIFPPAILSLVLRPEKEAIIFIILYYSIFVLINCCGISNFSLEGYQIILTLLIDSLSLFFIYYYVNQTRILREKLEMRNRVLNEEVITDSLTNIPNRKAFNRRVRSFVSNYKDFDEDFSIGIIDIDFFKKINDEFGHEEGDIVLKNMAQNLNSLKRKGDFVARYGGEEFIIILQGCSNEEAEKISNRIREQINEKSKADTREITVSIGVSQMEKEDDVTSLLRKADKALYKAKEGGRNLVCVN